MNNEVVEIITSENIVEVVKTDDNVIEVVTSDNVIDIVLGNPGPKGADGESATIQIGSVITGDAGTNVIITNSGNETDAVFNFTIPRGADGYQGQDGAPGQDGKDGLTTSVNGIEQIDGNITLTASDIGADEAGSADIAEANAKTYSDNQLALEAEVLQDYADTAASNALTDAQSYADTVSAIAEANANDYADANFIPDTALGNTVATLVDGKVPNSQLPPLAITDTYVVNSQSAMLALDAQVGDVAVRSDISKSYILHSEPASTLGNWQELLTPPNAVLSVDGRIGSVSLSDLYDTYGAAASALTSANSHADYVAGLAQSNAETYADGAAASAQANAISTSESYTDAQIAAYVPTQLHVYVKNQTGSTIAKGAAVYISGGTGANPLISLAQANAENTSSKTLGLTESSIANGGFGYVIIAGSVSNIDTSAATADGDPVWLSPTTPGGLIYGLANKPHAPNHMVFIGFVTRKSSTVGVIDVRVQNGFELDELHNVDNYTNTLADGDVLAYEASTSLWKNVANYVKKTIANTWTAVQTFVSQAITDTPIIIKGISGQTANLFNITKSDNTSVFSVNPNGYASATDVQAGGGIRVGTSVSYTTGKDWVSIQDTTQVPSSVSGGGILYESSGELYHLSSSGVVAAIAPKRTTATYTTASLANGAYETGVITMSKGYRLYSIQTSALARVRLYTSTTGRDADINRVALSAPTVIIPSNVGLIFDYVTENTSSNDVQFNPGGFSSSSSIPITINNLSGSTAAITVTLTYIKTEV